MSPSSALRFVSGSCIDYVFTNTVGTRTGEKQLVRRGGALIHPSYLTKHPPATRVQRFVGSNPNRIERASRLVLRE